MAGQNSSSELGDEDYIQAAIQGDKDAFSYLYEKNVTRIYNYIFYRTGNSNDAEDLTARVFYRAMGSIQRYQQKGVPFSAWLYRIAHNMVANWHRDNSRRKEISLEDQLDLPSKGEQPETTLLRNQESQYLILMIHGLPAERQQLVILKFVEGLSNAEIALIMNRSEGAVKSLYHRTLENLRIRMDESEGL
jgi:RNA polymerase sigma-70 factor (ECF subfamily)